MAFSAHFGPGFDLHWVATVSVTLYFLLKGSQALYAARFAQRQTAALRRWNTTEVSDKGRKVVGYWLLGCSGMVAGAVVIGEACFGLGI